MSARALMPCFCMMSAARALVFSFGHAQYVTIGFFSFFSSGIRFST
jgi:hypothetical protein